MTTQTVFDPPEPLPGLEKTAPANTPPIVRALHRTIAALDEAGLIDEAHAFHLEAMRTLARSAGMKLATGKASTLANDLDLALRTLEGIVHPEQDNAGVDESLRAAMAEFERALDEAEA